MGRGFWVHEGCWDSFGGWYISTEISRRTKGATEAFRTSGQLTKEAAVALAEYEREWGEIFDGIRGAVDAVAFKDGHLYNRYREYVDKL